MGKFLGLEGTAHTLGVAVFDEEEGFLSNEMDSVIPTLEKGFIPRELADHHSQHFPRLFKLALSKANTSMEDVEAIAFSQGPGIGSPLSFTVSMARYLSVKYGKPLVGVNHPYAHLKVAEYFYEGKNPVFIYVSGGNTQILVKDREFYRVYGETIDVGVGNFFDNAARILGINPPTGYGLYKVALKGKFLDEVPYTVKGTNVSFSGLLNVVKKLDAKKEDVAYTIMSIAFSEIVEVAERVFHLVNADGFVLCGGVAQNKILQHMVKKVAEENGVLYGWAKDEFNRDNGAMIAYAGYYIFNKFGGTPLDKAIPLPYYRIDEVEEVVKSWRM